METYYKGLSQEEAKKRLKEYGLNEIPQKRENIYLNLLKRFISPVNILLEITIVLTFLINRYYDSAIISFLLLFNIFISFLHEKKAKDALEILKKKIEINANVLRDGKWQEIPAKYLTVGDVVSLRQGDIIPADCKILNGSLSIDESVITGESLPKDVKENDEIYMGAIVSKGNGICEVIRVGKNSFYGKSAQLLKLAKKKGILEEVVFKLVTYLFILSTFVIILLFLDSLKLGFNLKEVLPLFTVIFIPIIPVALPAAFSIASTLGALSLSKEGVLVTDLGAMEGGASMDILCSDKTGTITKNSIELSHTKPIEDFNEEDLILFSYLCSSKDHYDMIDKAIINFFEKNKDKFQDLSFTLKEFDPFDPSKKYSQSKALINQKEVIIKKGSPSVLLDDKEKKLYEELIKSLASQGLRVLALVVIQNNTKKVAGFLGFSDPPREDSKELITKIKELGVKVKMLTGDTKETAQYIGKLVGIEGKTCDKTSIEEDCEIFANVYPEDKFNIVKFYQSKNHIVGMTGDGVNDAPALKQANLGIAVANATDAAKAAGGIILTQEGLRNILSCIILSRQIYERMLTYVFNKTVKALNTVFIIAIFFIVMKNFILTPTLLVIQFFFNDFITLAIVTDNVHYSKKPSRWKISKLILVSIIFATFVIILTFSLIYFLGIKLYHLNIKELQTYAFLSIVLAGNLSLLVIRERQGFFKTLPSKALSLSIFISIFLSTTMSIFGFLMKALPISIVLYTYGLLFLAYFFYEGLKTITLKYISIS